MFMVILYGINNVDSKDISSVKITLTVAAVRFYGRNMALSRPAKSSEKPLSPLPQLIPLAVPPEELRCAEYCFRVAVDFSAKFKDDPGTEFLKQILTGLLNTSGGIITIIAKQNTSCDRHTLDGWKLKLEDCLTMFVPTDVCRSCIHLLDYSLPITMLVRKSPKLITVNCNMCIRWLAGNKSLEDLDTIRAVVTQVPTKTRCPHPLAHIDSVLYKSTIDISEGPNVEFKFWKSVKMFDHPRHRNTYKTRLQDERTQRTMFSLPNMPSGGYLILGVDENVMTKTNTVLGQIISEQDEGMFVTFIDSFLRMDTRGNERVWGRARRTPRQGVDWAVELIPVTGCSAQERRRVIVISFNHFVGGVFHQCPESYLISEDGFVAAMHTDEWFQHLNNYGYQQQHQYAGSISSMKNLKGGIGRINVHSTYATRTEMTTPGVTSSSELPHSSNTEIHNSSSESPQTTSPDLIVQNADNNHHSPSVTTICAASPMTTHTDKDAKGKCCLPEETKAKAGKASVCSEETVCEKVTASSALAKSADAKLTDANLRTSPQDVKPCAPLQYHVSRQDGLSTQTPLLKTDEQSSRKPRGVENTNDDPRMLGNTDEEWIKTREFLSWTKHRTSWKQPIGDSDLILVERIRQFAAYSMLFRMTTPMTLNPSKRSIVRSLMEHSRVDEAIQYVQQSTKDEAFGLATTNWMSTLQTGIKPCTPVGKLLDVFSTDGQCNLRLWSIIESGVFKTDGYWQYLFLAGRLTKRKVLVDQVLPARHEFISSVAVDCRLYQLHFGEIPNVTLRRQDISSDILTFFKPTEDCLEDVKTSLAQSLLVNETRIKDIFGEENSIHLTIEQMEIILALGLDKFSFIEGAPGSGKTYLALHMCQKHRCAYLCTTRPFIKFLEFQNVQYPILLETASDLSRCIKKNSFAEFEYLLIDDVHNSSLPKASWITLFEYIANTPQIKLVVLGDSHYQNYKAQSGAIREYLQDFCMINNFRPMFKSLSIIHRNNRKIASFVKANFMGNPQYPESLDIACTHTENGDDVEIRYLPDFMSNTASNSLLGFCQSLTDPQLVILNASLSYEPKDVVILVDTIRASDDSKKLREIFTRHVCPHVSIHDASTYPVTGYTIDTLDNFMGFDR